MGSPLFDHVFTWRGLLASSLTLFMAMGILGFVGCSDKPKTDLAQEMAARKGINAIDLLAKNGKMEKAITKLKELELTFGHTNTYKGEKRRLLNLDLSTDDPEIV